MAAPPLGEDSRFRYAAVNEVEQMHVDSAKLMRLEAVDDWSTLAKSIAKWESECFRDPAFALTFVGKVNDWIHFPDAKSFVPFRFASIVQPDFAKYQVFGSGKADGYDFAQLPTQKKKLERWAEAEFGYQSDLHGDLRLWARKTLGEGALARVSGTLWRFLVVSGVSIPFDVMAESVTSAEAEQGAFSPEDEEDGRRRVLAAIVRRRGQPQFRQKLLSLYQGRCAVTGCAAEAALEAAHITPYKGTRTNAPSNGLLLRADVHTLFDLGLIAIDEHWRVMVAEELGATEYAEFNGQEIQLPAKSKPSRAALSAHREQAKSRHVYGR